MKRPRRVRRSAKVREAAPAYVVQPALRLLLDTQVWLWWNANDRRLGPEARVAIRGAVDVCFSVASAWEIAIKQSLGKLDLPKGVDIGRELAADGFRLLPIELAHAAGVASLPDIHRDPFDRMLVSQAVAEGLTVLTADERIRRYDVMSLSASR